MNIWKRFSIFVISMLLVTILAACGGGGSSADSAGSTPTAAAPTSTPTTGGSQSAGGCTTAAECQKAVITVTPQKVKAGGKVTVTVKGWMANTEAVVSITIDAAQGALVAHIASGKTDAQGNITATLTIYSNVSPITADVHIGQDQSGSDPVDTSKDIAMAGGLTII